MISDLVRRLVRRARRWQRQRRFRVLFLLAILLPWCAVFLQLESDLPSIPTRFDLDWMGVSEGVSPEDFLETEKCLKSAGLYTVAATEVTIIQPLVLTDDNVTWAERDAKEHGNRASCSVFPSPTNSSVLSFQQPLFATPANLGTIESFNQSNVSSLLEIAKAYFFRRSGSVIKTKKPFRYTCRAVLQKGLQSAPNQGQHTFYSVIRKSTSTTTQYDLPSTLTFLEPESRSVLCEALTPEDKAQHAVCSRKRGNLCIAILEPRIVISRLPAIASVLKQRDSIFGDYMHSYVFIPMANGHAFRLNAWYLSYGVILELYYLFIAGMVIWYSIDSLLSHLDNCTRQDIALPAGDALRWLTSASHRLHHHLPELMAEKIITPEQYAQLGDREEARGRVYIHPLLRRFIVSNGTLDALRLYVTKTGIQIPDGYQTQTSSESDSDDESNAHPLAIIAVSQLFKDSSFERLLELTFITSHQYVRIYDTRDTRSPYEAARLLIRVVQRNNKGGEFLAWFCREFRVPEYERRRIALAPMAPAFEKLGAAVRARDGVWRVQLLLPTILMMGAVVSIFFYPKLREHRYLCDGFEARQRV